MCCYPTDIKKAHTQHQQQQHRMHTIKIQRNHLKLINFLFEMESLTQFTHANAKFHQFEARTLFFALIFSHKFEIFFFGIKKNPQKQNVQNVLQQRKMCN